MRNPFRRAFRTVWRALEKYTLIYVYKTREGYISLHFVSKICFNRKISFSDHSYVWIKIYANVLSGDILGTLGGSFENSCEI